MFRHGRYIGSRKDLYGETVMIESLSGPIVQVQFDNFDKFDHNSDERLALGWHAFPETDFQIFDELEDSSIPLMLRIVPIIFIVAWAAAIYGVIFVIKEIFG